MEFNSAPYYKCGLEEGLDAAGFGKYNVAMVLSCSLLILGMCLDMFGVSVALPSMACELHLTTQQQGFISAISLIGVLISSYPWGLCADIFGRRRVLMLAMPIGVVLCMATTFAPTYSSLVSLKFLSGCFTSSANAAGLALLGESVPRRWRSQCVFLMTTAVMCSQLVVSAFALPVIGLDFHIPIPWLGLDYTPWRLAVFFNTLPGLVGILMLIPLSESPKFILSKGREDQALGVLRRIYHCNKGSSGDFFSKITSVFLDDLTDVTNESAGAKVSIFHKLWNQTAPLLKPPLLKNSAIIYYLFFCAYMIATAFAMFIPSVANVYFNRDSAGKTFCEVASTLSKPANVTATVPENCNNVINPFALYACMVYSIGATSLNFVVMIMEKPVGRKATTLLVFVISTFCGFLLLYVRIPLVSLGLFYMFLYICLMMGNCNAYLVELNPTHLRGMATCLSVIVARGFGFVSVQIIASLITDSCTYMMYGYIALAFSGLVVASFLPPDKKGDDGKAG